MDKLPKFRDFGEPGYVSLSEITLEDIRRAQESIDRNYIPAPDGMYLIDPPQPVSSPFIYANHNVVEGRVRLEQLISAVRELIRARVGDEMLIATGTRTEHIPVNMDLEIDSISRTYAEQVGMPPPPVQINFATTRVMQDSLMSYVRRKSKEGKLSVMQLHDTLEVEVNGNLPVEEAREILNEVVRLGKQEMTPRQEDFSIPLEASQAQGSRWSALGGESLKHTSSTKVRFPTLESYNTQSKQYAPTSIAPVYEHEMNPPKGKRLQDKRRADDLILPEVLEQVIKEVKEASIEEVDSLLPLPPIPDYSQPPTEEAEESKEVTGTTKKQILLLGELLRVDLEKNPSPFNIDTIIFYRGDPGSVASHNHEDYWVRQETLSAFRKFGFTKRNSRRLFRELLWDPLLNPYTALGQIYQYISRGRPITRLGDPTDYERQEYLNE